MAKMVSQEKKGKEITFVLTKILYQKLKDQKKKAGFSPKFKVGFSLSFLSLQISNV
jgi:hypothetical protein